MTFHVLKMCKRLTGELYHISCPKSGKFLAGGLYDISCPPSGRVWLENCAKSLFYKIENVLLGEWLKFHFRDFKKL